MRSHFYKISFACCILFCNLTYAQNAILCPSLNKIQASRIDTAQKINGDDYIVYTATAFYQKNNIWWFAGVGDIKAHSNNEALHLGREILQKINNQINIHPNKIGNEWICSYGPGYVQARGKNLI